MITTAETIAGDSTLYNLVWQIGTRGKEGWECTGMNKAGTRVRFARLDTSGDFIHVRTVYVLPDCPMRLRVEAEEYIPPLG